MKKTVEIDYEANAKKYKEDCAFLKGHNQLMRKTPMGQFQLSKSTGDLLLTFQWGVCGYSGYCTAIKNLKIKKAKK